MKSSICSSSQSRACRSALALLFAGLLSHAMPVAAADSSSSTGNQGTADPSKKLELLIQAGVLNGAKEDSNLDGNMTRAQFATILAKLVMNNDGTTPNAVFTDIDTTWSSQYIAAAAGIIDGIKEQAQFDPSGPVDKAFLTALMQSLGANNIGGDSNTDWIRNVVFAALGTQALPPGSEGQVVPLFPGLQRGPDTSTEVVLNDILAASIAAQLQGSQVDFPYFNAGTLTPQANWPISLNATYNGRISGALQDSTRVGGSITMNVNFANFPQAQPVVPGNIVFDNGKGSANFNLARFGTVIGDGMTGTYNGEALIAGSYIMNGKFYGPAANEVGGDWTIKTNSVEGGGKFAAKR